ncbi:MAG: ASKHA domain-containing protein [Thermodesulfobacteriota bacterium]
MSAPDALRLRLAPPAEAEGPTPLMDLLTAAGHSLRFDCGGLGVCGKCLVRVEPADAALPPEAVEIGRLDPDQLRTGLRLACQVRVLAPLAVEIPRQTFSSREASGKTDLSGRFPVAPLLRRHTLRLATAGDGAASLGEAAALYLGRPLPPARNLGAARQLAAAAEEGREATLVLHDELGLTAAHPGSRPRSLGLALDIGTTTLAAYLCDFASGELLAAANSANPQRRLGEDVISRIAYAASHADGLDLLGRLVREEINALALACLEQAGGAPEDIDEVVAVGNPTMQQLFCGLDPRGLGAAPYWPLIRNAQNYAAGELGLDLNPGVNVHVFPVVSGFVGGDTLAAVLADGLHARPETTLLVDIGTNGEVVLAHAGRLWATSCATGPALEGAHLSAGMRAVTGAISRLAVDPVSLEVTGHVIGAEKGALPSGLCGSGIIDAVAGLRRAGVVRANGRLNEDAPGVAVDADGIGRAFSLVPAAATATGRDIALTLNDVRQIQLAKAALAAGIKLLLAEAGSPPIARLVLTGAFGARFDWTSAVAIGMLPAGAGRVESMVNAAGRGAVVALLDRGQRQQAARLAESIRVLELAEHPDFPLTFAEQINFPPLTPA